MLTCGKGIEAVAMADDRIKSAYINRVLRQHIEAVTGTVDGNRT
jgi:hypothetical protein